MCVISSPEEKDTKVTGEVTSLYNIHWFAFWANFTPVWARGPKCICEFVEDSSLDAVSNPGAGPALQHEFVEEGALGVDANQ